MKLFPVAATDASIQAKIDDLERKLSNTEFTTLEQTFDDLPRITEVVLSELASELHVALGATDGVRGRTSFLALPLSAKVRVTSSEHAFPTVRHLVEEMEHRRDNAESKAKKHVLELEADLVTAEIMYAVHAMRAAISRAQSPA